MYYKMKILLFIFICALYSCSTNEKELSVKTGDILFSSPELNKADYTISHAINKVTQVEQSNNYTHMGIVVNDDSGFWVIHANPDSGVSKDTIQKYIEKYPNTFVYRLKNNYKQSIPSAINKLGSFLGQPYDYAYIINDSSQYCSGLIYSIFAEYDIFELEPMTFKNPDSDIYNDFWVYYYDSIGIPIPEGKLGCNPNKMSQSNRLERIGALTKVKSSELSITIN